MGHTVAVAANGREALNLIVGQLTLAEFESIAAPVSSFDLLMTEVDLPEMDGFQLAQAVKQVSPSTPVVLLTAFGTILEARDTKPEGIDYILSKPINLVKLQEALRHIGL